LFYEFLFLLSVYKTFCFKCIDFVAKVYKLSLHICSSSTKFF
jgi:hypothetical protein